MMRKLAMLLGVILPAMAAVPAFAGDDPAYDRFFLMPNAGTLGPGIEAGVRWNESWTTRVGVNGFAFDYLWHDRHWDSASKISLLSAGATVDYHPFGGDFRLSAGLRFADNQITGRLKNLEGTIHPGGRPVQVFIKDPLTSFKVTQNPIQPYLGAGYEVHLKDRLSLTFDLGALYTGRAELDVDTRAQRYGFTRRQINRAIARAEDRVGAYPFYPVVQIGLKFSF